ncbi:MAG: heme ABC transporter ATP-binding protein [Chloroflexi bacterium]|nr:heme ABC transporter ATP-binding protein [Chloroflexota bacterium]
MTQPEAYHLRVPGRVGAPLPSQPSPRPDQGGCGRLPSVGLQTQAVSYRVGSRALVDDMSLELLAGEVLALVGPNGAGKSTLLRLLAGDLLPSEGEVRPHGLPLWAYGVGALAKQRAVMPQSTFLGFAFPVLDVVLMGRHPHVDGRDERPQDLEAARRAMERTETLDLVERRYPTLSGGEQARVTLARVLAQETPVLLLDEPTAHLDPRHQHATMALARTLSDCGGAVLAVLHDLNLAAVYADRVGLMADGRLMSVGPPAEVLTADRLEAVLSIAFAVTRHPTADRPLIVPMPTSRVQPETSAPVTASESPSRP